MVHWRYYLHKALHSRNSFVLHEILVSFLNGMWGHSSASDLTDFIRKLCLCVIFDVYGVIFHLCFSFFVRIIKTALIYEVKDRKYDLLYVSHPPFPKTYQAHPQLPSTCQLFNPLTRKIGKSNKEVSFNVLIEFEGFPVKNAISFFARTIRTYKSIIDFH